MIMNQALAYRVRRASVRVKIRVNPHLSQNTIFLNLSKVGPQILIRAVVCGGFMGPVGCNPRQPDHGIDALKFGLPAGFKRHFTYLSWHSINSTKQHER